MNMHMCLYPLNQGEETGLKVWTATKIIPGVVLVHKERTLVNFGSTSMR